LYDKKIELFFSGICRMHKISNYAPTNNGKGLAFYVANLPPLLVYGWTVGFAKAICYARFSDSKYHQYGTLDPSIDVSCHVKRGPMVKF